MRDNFTHTLTSCYIGTSVIEDGGEDRTKRLEPLLSLISASQLDAQQGENVCRCRLLLSTAYKNEGGRYSRLDGYW